MRAFFAIQYQKTQIQSIHSKREKKLKGISKERKTAENTKKDKPLWLSTVIGEEINSTPARAPPW